MGLVVIEAEVRTLLRQCRLVHYRAMHVYPDISESAVFRGLSYWRKRDSGQVVWFPLDETDRALLPPFPQYPPHNVVLDEDLWHINNSSSIHPLSPSYLPSSGHSQFGDDSDEDMNWASDEDEAEGAAIR